MAPGLKVLSILALTLSLAGSSIANTATTEQVNHEAATNRDAFYPIKPPAARRDEAITDATNKITDILPKLPVPLPKVPAVSGLSTREEADVNNDEAMHGESFYPIVPPGCVVHGGRLKCAPSISKEDAAAKRVIAVRRPSAREDAQ